MKGFVVFPNVHLKTLLIAPGALLRPCVLFRMPSPQQTSCTTKQGPRLVGFLTTKAHFCLKYFPTCGCLEAFIFSFFSFLSHSQTSSGDLCASRPPRFHQVALLASSSVAWQLLILSCKLLLLLDLSIQSIRRSVRYPLLHVRPQGSVVLINSATTTAGSFLLHGSDSALLLLRDLQASKNPRCPPKQSARRV